MKPSRATVVLTSEPVLAMRTLTLQRDDELVIDLRAIRSDAVVEAQAGVTVLARRDSDSENSDELRIAPSVMRGLGPSFALVVFVTAPRVEHGRTLASAGLPVRHATIECVRHDALTTKLAMGAALAMFAAVTAFEAAVAVRHSTVARTALCVLCVAGGAWVAARLVRESRLAKHARRPALFRFAGALAVLAAPFFVGERELRDDEHGRLESDVVSLPSVAAVDRYETALSWQSTLGARAPRWSERWFPVYVRRPAHPALSLSRAQVERLGLGDIARCSGELCSVLSAAWVASAGVAIRRPECEAPCPPSVETLAARVRMQSYDDPSLAVLSREWRTQGVFTSFATSVELHFAVGPVTVMAVTEDARRFGRVAEQRFLIPIGDEGRFVSVRDERLRRCNREDPLVVAGLAPAFARPGEPFRLPTTMNDHAAVCPTNRLEERTDRTLSFDVSVLDAQSTAARVGHVVEVPSDVRRVVVYRDEIRSINGFADCPAVIDEQREELLLARVYGLGTERGLALSPTESSQRAVGRWSPYDVTGAANSAVVCVRIQGENLPRARVTRWPVDVPARWATELPVVVGSLASEGSGRGAKLVPRIEQGQLAGYDLEDRTFNGGR
ncbi:MAG: hypothetical protein U0269_33230 [Polyangiales bacterium]